MNRQHRDTILGNAVRLSDIELSATLSEVVSVEVITFAHWRRYHHALGKYCVAVGVDFGNICVTAHLQDTLK